MSGAEDVAAACQAITADYCRGGRASTARLALETLTKEHPSSALPHRYLARLLYHEAAGVTAPAPSQDKQQHKRATSSRATADAAAAASIGDRRIVLLHEALLHAVKAVQRAPNSLSCAALRATLTINLLIEESVLLGRPSPLFSLPAAAQPPPPPKPRQPATAATSNAVGRPATAIAAAAAAADSKCEELKRRFEGSLKGINTALTSPAPIIDEPVITLTTKGGHTTYDPCSLQAQEQVVAWAAAGRWEELLAEKRAVLGSMRQVLESCHALLDSTRVPTEGVMQLLQHVIRPQQNELQMWVQRLLGGGAGAAAAALGADGVHRALGVPTQASVSELLQLLRGPAVVPEAPSDNVLAVEAETDESDSGSEGGNVLDTSSLALSIVKDWGGPQDAPLAPQRAGARKGKARAASSKGAAASSSRGRARTRRERFMDVETFWRSTTPKQRRELLRVPLGGLLEGVKREAGSEAAEELMEGLVLLREQSNRGARYWLCPACDHKFHSSRDFLAHVEAFHEELAPLARQQAQQRQQRQQRPGEFPEDMLADGYEQLAALERAGLLDGDEAAMAGLADDEKASPEQIAAARAKLLGFCNRHKKEQQVQQQQQQPQAPQESAEGYVKCSRCLAEVVGMYYANVLQPGSGNSLCLRCYTQEVRTLGSFACEQQYERVLPRAAAASLQWTDSSEYVSTKGSFSSMADGEDARLPCAPLPAHVSAVLELDGSGSGDGDGSGDGSVSDGSVQVPSAVDALCESLIGELEAVHAARQRHSQAAPQNDATAAASPAAAGIGGGSGGRTNSDASAVSSRGSGNSSGTRASADEPRSALTQALQEEAALAADAASADTDALPDQDIALEQPGSASSSAAADAEAGGRSWRSWLLPRKLRQWAGEAADGQLPQQLQQQLQQQQGAEGARARSLQLPPDASRDGSSDAAGEAGAPWSTPLDPEAAAELLKEELFGRSGPSTPNTPAALDTCGTARQHKGTAEAAALAEVASNEPALLRELQAHIKLREQRRQQREQQQQAGGQQATRPAAGDVADPINASAVLVSHRLQLPETAAASHPSPADAPKRSAGHSAAAHTQNKRRRRSLPRDAPEEWEVGAMFGDRGSEELADGLMQRMMELYGADRELADLALGSVIDYSHRRLTGGSAATGAAAAVGAAGAGAIGGPGAATMAAAGAPAAALDVDIGRGGSSSSQAPGAALTREAAAAAAALPDAARALVAQFLAAPHVVYRQPDVLRAVLLCLQPQDLETAAAYVAGQHREAVLAPGAASGSEAGTASDALALEDEPGCVPLFNLYLLNETTFEALVERIWPGELEQQQQLQHGIGSSMGGGSSSAATCEHGGSCAGCGRDMQRSGSKEAPGLDAASEAAAGIGRRRAQRHHHGHVLARADSAAAAAAAGNAADAAAAAAAGLMAASPGDEPYLLPAEWWLEHLAEASSYEDAPGDCRGEVRVLRWVYGNIASAHMEEFAARQAELRGALSRSDAILELYEGIASAWRRMQALSDRKRVLDDARRATRASFCELRRLEELGQHCSHDEACAFLEAVFTSLCTATSPSAAGADAAGGSAGFAGQRVGAPGSEPQAAAPLQAAGAALLLPPPSAALAAASSAEVVPTMPSSAADGSAANSSATGAAAGAPKEPAQLQVRLNQLAPLYMCGAAVDVVKRSPGLAKDASQRYARALLEREIAVLSLVASMLGDEGERARARQAEAAERLRLRRQELRDAEAEHARVVAEGPASHRKRDILDKATKEAEHRERVAELVSRVAVARDGIAADEAATATAATSAAEAAADLARVQEQARQIGARNKNLADLNVQLEAPPPSAAILGGPLPPPQQQQQAAAPQVSLSVDGIELPLPGSIDPASISTAAELGWSWRAQRLECLMYRVLWVAEAVKLFRDQYCPRTGGRQYELLVRASKWARGLSAEYDAGVKACCQELSVLRAKLAELACVDLSMTIHAAAVSHCRTAIEAAAARARELASQQLLLELEEEEAARKVPSGAERLGSGPVAGAGGEGGKGGAGKKGKKQKERNRQAAKGAAKEEDEARRQQELAEAQKQRQQELRALETARAEREALLDAQLEARRRELEALAAAKEQELLLAAQEASLREQQEAAQRQLEAAQRHKEQAAAVAARAAAARAAAEVEAQLAAAAGAANGAAAVAADVADGTFAAAVPSERQRQGPRVSGVPAAAAGLAVVLPAEDAALAAAFAAASPAAGQPAGRSPKLRGSRDPAQRTPQAQAPAHKAKGGRATSKAMQQQQLHVHQPPPPPPPPPAASPGPMARGAKGQPPATTPRGTAKQAAAAGRAAAAARNPVKGTPPSPKQLRKAAAKAAAAAAATAAAAHSLEGQDDVAAAPLLDFGPTPAEAYALAAAAKAQANAAASGSADAGEPSTAPVPAQQPMLQPQQPTLQLQPQQPTLQLQQQQQQPAHDTSASSTRTPSPASQVHAPAQLPQAPPQPANSPMPPQRTAQLGRMPQGLSPADDVVVPMPAAPAPAAGACLLDTPTHSQAPVPASSTGGASASHALQHGLFSSGHAFNPFGDNLLHTALNYSGNSGDKPPHSQDSSLLGHALQRPMPAAPPMLAQPQHQQQQHQQQRQQQGPALNGSSAMMQHITAGPPGLRADTIRASSPPLPSQALASSDRHILSIMSLLDNDQAPPVKDTRSAASRQHATQQGPQQGQQQRLGQQGAAPQPMGHLAASAAKAMQASEPFMLPRSASTGAAASPVPPGSNVSSAFASWGRQPLHPPGLGPPPAAAASGAAGRAPSPGLPPSWGNGNGTPVTAGSPAPLPFGSVPVLQRANSAGGSVGNGWPRQQQQHASALLRMGSNGSDLAPTLDQHSRYERLSGNGSQLPGAMGFGMAHGTPGAAGADVSKAFSGAGGFGQLGQMDMAAAYGWGGHGMGAGSVGMPLVSQQSLGGRGALMASLPPGLQLHPQQQPAAMQGWGQQQQPQQLAGTDVRRTSSGSGFFGHPSAQQQQWPPYGR